MTKLDSMDRLFELVRRSGLIDPLTLERLADSVDLPRDPSLALDRLVEEGLLTRFHAAHLAQGRYHGFLLGSYKVLRPVGKGGMGLVYLAEHTTLGRRVALKVIRTDIQAVGSLERFFREGRAAAALDHPNIVRLIDFCTEGRTHFLVMEYIDGTSLEEVLARKGRMPIGQAVLCALQAARGIQHAHLRGIVHRDIKPANLLMDSCGTIKILDMGLARFMGDTTDNLTERLGGNPILGSPDYIAPEQALNRLDHRSDVYGLGATLYALLLGEPPFVSRTASQKLLAHQLVAPAAPHVRDGRIPGELSAVVLRMLAKNPKDRFQDFEQVIAALEPWANYGPSQQEMAELDPEERTNESPVRASSRWFSRAALLGGVFVIASLLLFLMWFAFHQAG